MSLRTIALASAALAGVVKLLGKSEPPPPVRPGAFEPPGWFDR